MRWSGNGVRMRDRFRRRDGASESVDPLAIGANLPNVRPLPSRAGRRGLIEASATLAGCSVVVIVALAAFHQPAALGPTDRTGVRDLSDGLTPRVVSYRWISDEVPGGSPQFSFSPVLDSVPPSPDTVHYFIRDLSAEGAGLSVSEQKNGKIVARGLITSTHPTIRFTLHHLPAGVGFAFEVYVDDAHGHTSKDGDVYSRIAEHPSTQSPAIRTGMAAERGDSASGGTASAPIGFGSGADRGASGAKRLSQRLWESLGGPPLALPL